jgi:transposase
MSKIAKFVGLDVHKKTIAIALAEGGPFQSDHEPLYLGEIHFDLGRLKHRLLQLGPPESLRVVYEAGPTGYGVCRSLRAAGIDCVIAAPSKLAREHGERVKTDKHDAIKLARQLRGGMVHSIVSLPGEETEALRDLVRAREDVVRALRSSRQQLGGFLLRHGRIWEGKSQWTKCHIEWVQSQRFHADAQRQVLVDALNEVHRLGERIERFTLSIGDVAETTEHAALYRNLQALRGVKEVVAATMVGELGDLRRFQSAGHLMSFVGLVPGEHSSGQKTKRGPITKTGNAHVRRVAIEAAWPGRLPPSASLHLKKRQEGCDPRVIDIATKAQARLHRVWRRLRAKNVPQNVALVAVARQLLGFVWAIGQVVDTKPI